MRPRLIIPGRAVTDGDRCIAGYESVATRLRLSTRGSCPMLACQRHRKVLVRWAGGHLKQDKHA